MALTNEDEITFHAGSGAKLQKAPRVVPGRNTMPEISRFLGIVIGMYYRDHAPPHFHATYGDYHMTVRLADGAVEGAFPGRARDLVLEWYHLHKAELLEDWELTRDRKPLRRIDPLE